MAAIDSTRVKSTPVTATPIHVPTPEATISDDRDALRS